MGQARRTILQSGVGQGVSSKPHIARAWITLHDWSREASRVDLDDTRPCRWVKWPHREPGIVEGGQSGHAPQRPGSHRAGTTNLEDGLGLRPTNRGDCTVGATQVVRGIGRTMLAGFAPERPVA